MTERFRKTFAAAALLTAIVAHSYADDFELWSLRAMQGSKFYAAFTCRVPMQRIQSQKTWNPLTEPVQLSPADATKAGFDWLKRQPHFQADFRVTAIHLQRCRKPFEDRWYYIVQFTGSRIESSVAKRALDQAFVFLDGSIIEPEFHEPPSP